MHPEINLKYSAFTHEIKKYLFVIIIKQVLQQIGNLLHDGDNKLYI